MRRFQVIQGGKGAGKEPVESGPALYRAYSISNLSKEKSVYYDVRFNWYCLERELSPFSYKDMIAGYEGLDPKQKSIMEREAARLFTGEEIEALRGYLGRRYGMTLEVERVALPIEERIYFFEEGSSVVYDFLELSEKEGYALPFKVWGYYTLEQCMASPELENGALFLIKAFERLNLAVDFSRSQLESVLRALYDEEGLFVRSREHEK